MGNYCEETRRISLICARFVMNAGYYRAQRECDSFSKSTSIHVTINSNFIDQVLLHWCHLFGNEDLNQHHWRRHFDKSLHESFRKGLLEEISIDENEYAEYLIQMKKIRNKWIAHVDDIKKDYLPHLDTAIEGVIYYYKFIRKNDGGCNAFQGIPDNLDDLYQQSHRDGLRLFSNIKT